MAILVEGSKPYTAGDGIGIDTNKVISVLLRAEDNLIKLNTDNELYTDLQLADGIEPEDELPVGITVGKVLEDDGWEQNGLLLNWKTTSGDYARWIYGADGEIYFDGGTGEWKQVYYSDEVDDLFTELRNSLATVAFTGDYNDLINRPEMPVVFDGELTITQNGTSVGTFTANQQQDETINITVPTKTSDLTNDSGYIDNTVDDLVNYTKTSDLAAVALSNDYTDLSNKPTIGDGTITIQKNGTAVDSFTANATTAKSINITMTKSDVGLSNVDNTSDANKPISTATQNALNLKANIADLAAVATSGAYSDLSGTPSLATVATTGDYDDLTDKPTIPTVINSLTSTDTSNALSAAQGKILNDKIADLQALGKFLSLWDCATGLPISFPHQTPYTYSTGDYFLVENVGTTTNYRPTGSSYTGAASTVVETDEIEIGDMYIYDGSVWLLQINHGKSVSFANLTGQPSDNAALSTALDAKQNNLATQTAYTSKGTASKVPQITTNTLGQVTGITEVNIDYPSQVSDTAYAASWNGVTSTAPSKNAVYDKISAMDTTISGKADSSSLATVATSGSYNDLTDKPSIPSGQIQSDWTQTNTAAVDYIKNKPTIPTVNNATLTITQNGTSAGTFTANASSNKTIALTDTTYESKSASSGGTAVSLVTTGEKYTWNNKQDTISDLSTIRSGAAAGATAVQPGSLATVATSGSYNDLSNKPTIPSVNNSTITFTQNGTSKGDITLNQSSNETIALTDTTYSNITKSEIQTGTASTQRTVSASVIKESLPTISGESNNILGYAKIRAGNKSDYDAMNSHDANTLYFCIDDGWKPGSNTIAYFPLENNSNEATGKVVTTTDNSVNYSTIGGVKCANLTSNGFINVSTSIFDNSSTWTEQTMSFWMYLNALPGGTSTWAFEFEKQNYYSFYFLARSNNVYRYEGNSAGSTIDVNIPSTDIGKWNYFTLVNSSSGKYMYKNGVLIGSGTGSSRPRGNRASSGGQNSTILNERDRREYLKGGLRELIFENKCWTATEISDYYNQNKSNYGL